MGANAVAGTMLVPTLSRLVLAAAFISAGYHKLFTVDTFNSDEVAVLRNLGASLTEIAPPSAEAAPASPSTKSTEPPPPTEAPPEPAAQTDTPSAERANDEAAPRAMSARRVYRIALLCHAHEWPYPYWAAWTAGLTEFIGGILLLVGLLSRVWGLGLAIAMGSAIVLTTWKSAMPSIPIEVARGMDGMALFNTFFAQAALGVLALGIFLTGPGPLSLDRLITGRRSDKNERDSTEPQNAPRQVVRNVSATTASQPDHGVSTQ